MYRKTIVLWGLWTVISTRRWSAQVWDDEAMRASTDHLERGPRAGTCWRVPASSPSARTLARTQWNGGSFVPKSRLRLFHVAEPRRPSRGRAVACWPLGTFCVFTEPLEHFTKLCIVLLFVKKVLKKTLLFVLNLISAAVRKTFALLYLKATHEGGGRGRWPLWSLCRFGTDRHRVWTRSFQCKKYGPCCWGWPRQKGTV